MSFILKVRGLCCFSGAEFVCAVLWAEAVVFEFSRIDFFMEPPLYKSSQIASISAPTFFLSREDMDSSLSAILRISGEYFFPFSVLDFPFTRYSTETFKADASLTATSAEGIELFSLR